MGKLKQQEVHAIVVFLIVALIMNEKFIKKKPAPQPSQPQYPYPGTYWGGPFL
ncbi:MAG: hypothetical protein FWF59_15690 [Turicibacter sp.]|nr:hypothetical protein [Turicibacter sp.]